MPYSLDAPLRCIPASRSSPAPMAEHLVFATGHLAEPRLRQVLAQMGETPFTWEVRNLGVKVAALMTPEIIRRRIGALEGVDRVILPGRCRGDLGALSAQ